MVPKPVHQITLADLEALAGVVRESRMLEFKQAMPGKAPSDVVPFLAGVSSLANTAGGDFILGITASEGLADAVPGIPVDNPDAEKLRLEQLLANGLDPRLPRVDIEAVPCPGRCFVFVIRVPRSWIGPHRVKANDKFYGRNSGGRFPLDVGELRTAFLLSETVADRVRAFRAERLAKIMAGDTPVALPAGGRAVLHVVPFPPFADRRPLDIIHMIANGTHVPLPLDGMSGGNRNVVNLDGYLNCGMDDRGTAFSYAQFFRSGAIEGVSPLEPDERTGRPFIPGTTLANRLVFALRQYLDVLRAYEIGLPVFAGVSLIGVDGCTLRYSSGMGRGFSVAGPRAGDMIVLPDVTIEAHPVDVPRSLKSTLDMLWNAFGFLQADVYDGRGEWTGVKTSET
jgi:hypothetical protein